MLDIGGGSEAAGVRDDRVALRLRACRVRQGRGPEPVESREDEPGSVRRRARATDLGDGQGRVVDGIVELDRWPHFLLDVGRKGDLRGFAGGHLDAHDLAAVAGYQRAGIVRPGSAGIDVAVAHAPALRLVALNIHDEPALLPARQVAQLERLTCVVAGRVDQPASVRARHRTEGTLVLVSAHEGAAGLAVDHRDLERTDLAGRALGRHIRVGVVGAETVAGSPCGEAAPQVAAHVDPKVAGIGAERGPQVGGRRWRALLAVSRHLYARAPVLVVEPELGPLVRHDVFAVRRPHRRHVVLALGVGELPRVRPVGACHPDVLRAVPVADEDDFGPVVRKARLHVVPLAAGDAGGAAPGYRQCVQVPEQFEDDRLPVRRQVKRYPRALVGREVEGARRNEGERVGTPRRPRGAVVLLHRLGGRDRGGPRDRRETGGRRDRHARRDHHSAEPHDPQAPTRPAAAPAQYYRRPLAGRGQPLAATPTNRLLALHRHCPPHS